MGVGRGSGCKGALAVLVGKIGGDTDGEIEGEIGGEVEGEAGGEAEGEAMGEGEGEPGMGGLAGTTKYDEGEAEVVASCVSHGVE